VAARCAVRDGYTGPENLSPAKVDERLHTHNVKKLADCLNRYMGYLSLIGPENRIDPESWQLLAWLDSEDETGETYRYAIVGQGADRTRARPVQKNINFYEQVNELHKLAHLLHGDTRPTWTSTSRCRRTSAGTDAGPLSPATAPASTISEHVGLGEAITVTCGDRCR